MLDGFPGNSFRLLLETKGPRDRFVYMQAVEQAFLPIHERGYAVLSVARKLYVENMAYHLAAGGNNFFSHQFFNTSRGCVFLLPSPFPGIHGRICSAIQR